MCKIFINEVIFYLCVGSREGQGLWVKGRFTLCTSLTFFFTMQKVRKTVGVFHFYITDFYFVIKKYFAWKNTYTPKHYQKMVLISKPKCFRVPVKCMLTWSSLKYLSLPQRLYITAYRDVSLRSRSSLTTWQVGAHEAWWLIVLMGNSNRCLNFKKRTEKTVIEDLHY